MWGKLKESYNSNKIQKNMLTRYGHVMGRDDDYIGRRALGIDIRTVW